MLKTFNSLSKIFVLIRLSVTRSWNIKFIYGISEFNISF